LWTVLQSISTAKNRPDLSLPPAYPLTLTGGPRSRLVTLMDAAALIRGLDGFRHARPVWDRGAETTLLAATSRQRPTLQKPRDNSVSRSIMKTGSRTRGNGPMPKTCFIIGPLGDPGSQVRADADDFMKYVVSTCPALKEFDYGEPIRADQLNEPGRITSQIIKLLMDADLVIADLTGGNPNVYYELSLRHALGKPVIHTALAGTPLPFDVRDNRTIFYTMHSRAAEQAREDLASQIRRVHQEGYKPMNPILETVGIINLERATDPVERSMGKIMEMVDSLGGDVKSIASALQQVRAEQDFHNRLLAISAPRIAGGVGPPGPAGGLFALTVPPSGYPATPPVPGGTGGILGNLLGLTPSTHTPPELKSPGKPAQKKP
jgi:hypothetical protein